MNRHPSAPPISTPAPTVECPRTFLEPLLRALGKLSGHTQAAQDRYPVYRLTLTEAGYDPDMLPAGWEAPASNGRPLIQETLRSLARSQEALISRPQRDTWALTAEGAERAAALNGVSLPSEEGPSPKSKGPNLTSQWLTKHLTPERGQKESKLMAMMKGALATHLALSVRRGLIDDHIQNFVVRVVRRDSFAKDLAAGLDLPYTKVASYCVNSGRSDARDMGTDPVCREMMGARTDKERKTPVADDPEVTVRTRHHTDTDGNMIAPDQVDVLDFGTLWHRIEGVVAARRPAAWDIYAPLIQLKVAGLSTQEIAAQSGMTRKRAAKLLASACQLVRDTCIADGEFQF